MKSRLLKVCSMVIIIALLVQLLPLQALALALDNETLTEEQDLTVSAEKIIQYVNADVMRVIA